MPGVKVLIKGLNKVIDFPVGSKMDDIGKHIQGNWSSVEEMSGLPMDAVSRKERAKHLGFSLPAVGALSMLAPEEVEASFLGQGAKKAALDMLGMAKKMEGSKIDADEIWQKTGWGKGADNKWRFEVDDSQSVLTVPDKASGKQAQDAYQLMNRLEDMTDKDLKLEMELMDFTGTVDEYKKQEIEGAYKKLNDISKSNYPLEAVLDNSALLDADPSLKGINTQFRNSWQSDKGAAFTPSEDSIRIGRGEEDQGSAMLHEVQHAIQEREGFAKGGNPETAGLVAKEHFNRLKSPLYKGNSQARSALQDMGRYGTADYISRLDKLSKSDNIAPSSILNLSDFYGYSDEIRGKFGSMPKTAAKGRNEWLQSAAAFIKNKNMANIDYYDLQLVKDAIADPKKNKSLYEKAKRTLSKNSDELNAFRGIEGEQSKFDKLTPVEQYNRLSGEVEARNVQSRLNMTQEERRLTPPWKTEDVPRGEQIVKYGGAGAAVGVAALSPEQAQAHQQAQKSFIESMLSDQSLESLPSFTTATAPSIDQMKLPQQYRADIGGFQAPGKAAPSVIHQAGGLLKKFDTPILGNPVEGLADYMINFGYDDSAKERAKRAASAGLDLI